MKDIKFISHLRMMDEISNKWLFQSNEEHSKGVAKLAASFAQKVGFEDWGVVMGLLHDKGKEQEGFQRYIRKVSGFMPEIKNAERTVGQKMPKDKVGHSLDMHYWVKVLYSCLGRC